MMPCRAAIILRDAGKRTRNGAVPVKIRLAVALRILAGASYLDVALLFGIANETVFHILWEVVDAINNTPKVGPFFFPRTREECARQAKEWEVGNASAFFFSVLIGLSPPPRGWRPTTASSYRHFLVGIFPLMKITSSS